MTRARAQRQQLSGAVPSAPDGAGAAVAAQLCGATKSFGAVQVLRDLDLTIPPGGITVVLGPSGVGKSTILRLLAGFESLDAGTVTLGGGTVDAPGTFVPARARRIGYVPQEGTLFPHLDVAENVGFGVTRRDRRHRTAELLELVGLAGLGARRPHELSGGQRQRVALARALAIEPHLVLLDEPFSALDAGLRLSLRGEVTALLHRTATTAVLVTHDRDEAFACADQLAVLHHGRIAQAGSPQQLWHRPTDSFVARFLRAGTLLAAHAHGDGSATCALGRLRVQSPREPTTGSGQLLVRPDQVTLGSPTGHRAADAPALTGRITDAHFQGDHYLLTVEVTAAGAAPPSPVGALPPAAADGPGWPSARLVVRQPARALPALGEPVGVTVAEPVLFLAD